jgi:hypothetical protein
MTKVAIVVIAVIFVCVDRRANHRSGFALQTELVCG